MRFFAAQHRWFLLWLVITSANLCLANEEPSDAPIEEPPIADVDRTHWAYRPLLNSPIPKVADVGWCREPLDVFVLSQLESKGLTGAAEASRATYIRRVTFDLTGLPPTPEELAAFLADESADAHARLVDRLLASSAYGERAAQHWLDLARFAETDGFEHDKIRSDAWQYRDWVVRAFNDDLSYADFLRYQLAGDELDEGQHAVATMFCLAGPDMPDVNDQLERRHFRLNELTATVGAVFLGMQIGCAECHDHKYDPLSQADFYRLRAIFEPSVPELQRDKPYNALSVQKEVILARLWLRGDHRRPGPLLTAAPPRIAITDDVWQQWRTSSGTEGLRSRFAETLTTQAAAITARVMVNRVWQQHFVRGLCETSSDFGLINSEPTHPELLDWLAADFVAHGWSLKRLHRQLVLSSTYRQQSRPEVPDETWTLRLERDADLYWLSRAPRRRLDGESLRDALLMVSGQLQQAAEGPGVRPPLPQELVKTLLKGQWVVSENVRDHSRRSLYLLARRNLRFPLFEAFDRPDANASCAVRGRSTTAPQALVLLNSELSLAVAQHLATRAFAAAENDSDRLDWLFRATLSRDPEAEELSLFRKFLGDAEDSTAWTDLCRALLNSSEFVYCD